MGIRYVGPERVAGGKFFTAVRTALSEAREVNLHMSFDPRLVLMRLGTKVASPFLRDLIFVHSGGDQCVKLCRKY